MIGKVKTGLTRLRTEGIGYVMTKAFEQEIRNHVPSRGYVEYNGVKVTERRLGDRLAAVIRPEYEYQDKPSYEGPLVSAIRTHFNGESAVLVGGGWGVSTVVAARAVGWNGSVQTYEGSKTCVERVRRTAVLNDVEDCVTATHAVIGDEYSLKGAADRPAAVRPEDLPDADGLIIDCDGCEYSVLSRLSAQPRTLIVEHHAVMHDGEVVVQFEPDRIRELLHGLGYEIVDETAINHYVDKLVIFVARPAN